MSGTNGSTERWERLARLKLEREDPALIEAAQAEGLLPEFVQEEVEKLRKTYAKPTQRKLLQPHPKPGPPQVPPAPGKGYAAHKKLGPRQAAVYMILRESGPLTGREIYEKMVERGAIERSDKPVARIWHMVRSLHERGLVTIEGENPRMVVKLRDGQSGVEARMP